MLIDLHAHHLTPAMFDRDPHWGPTWTGLNLKIGDYILRNRKMPALSKVAESDGGKAMFDRMDHPFRLGVMDQLGIDKMVVSIPPLMFMYWTGDFGVDYAKLCNDELARWCAVEPDTFMWWATAPMHRPEAAAAELERAVGMGAVGLYLAPAGLGEYKLHSPELDVVWAKVNELNVPLFVHGYPRAMENGTADEFNSGVSMGYLNDESSAFWNLICGGVLDRFPKMRVYITHAGGFVPYQLERLAENWDTLAYDSVNELPFLDYLPRFYFDPMIHNAVMRRALVEMIGPERFVYGSNFGGSDQIDFDLTDGIGLSEADRERIKSANAIELLNLESRLAARL